MIAHSSFQRVLLLTLLAFIAGCSSSNSPTSNTTTPTNRSAGAFGYSNNGTVIDRKDYPTGASGSAMIQSGAVLGLPDGTRLLTVNLMTEQIQLPNFHVAQLSLLIPFSAAAPGTFNVGNGEAPLLAEASYSIDSFSYKSTVGGSIVITEFDTAKNTVSGTFSFDLQIRTPATGQPTTIHITSGFFEKIPIYLGSFNQGTITASIGSQQFISGSVVTAYTISGIQMLTIMAGSSIGDLMMLTIMSPKVGTFSLTQSGGFTSSSASYASTAVSISSEAGTVTITKYDAATHRMDATFTFSGKDQTSGQTVNVTNGVINNVQWFDLKAKPRDSGPM